MEKVFSSGKKILRKSFLFLRPIFQTVLHAGDQLKQTMPSRPARKKKVADPIRRSQGAQNAEKGALYVLPEVVAFVTKNSTNAKLKSPNGGPLEGNGPHQCDSNSYSVAADSDETQSGAGMVEF